MMNNKTVDKTPTLNDAKSSSISIPEIHQCFCMYDDNKTKPDCPVQNTHAYWIGLRGDCRNCEVYLKWQVGHKEELEALRRSCRI